MNAGLAAAGDDSPPGRQESAFRVQVGCPLCGAEIVLTSIDRAAWCEHCRASHLVDRLAEVGTFVIPDRTGDGEAALDAFFQDEARRRTLDLAAGRAGTQLASGKAERWAARVREGTRLLGHSFFFAPYWHLSGRFYEAVLGRREDGTKCAAAAVRGVEVSHPAFAAGLRLPALGKVSYLTGLRPYPAARDGHAGVSPSTLPVLPVATPREEVDRQAERLGSTQLVRGLDRLARDARLWAEDYHLVLRPFHLLDLEVRGEDIHFLLDGHGGSTAGTLPAAAAAELRAAFECAKSPATEVPFALRPMRCPECAAAFPLERSGEIRFCGGCGKAYRLDGGKLTAARYATEEAGGDALHLPFWSFRFVLRDPRDGDELRSPAAVATKLTGRPAAATEHAAEPLWVPAFRPEDRRRAPDLYQRLFDLRRAPAGTLRRGAAWAGSGWSRPARFVSIGEREAAFLARHALLLAMPEKAFIHAPIARIQRLLFDAPIEVDSPALVLRAFRKGDVSG